MLQLMRSQRCRRGWLLVSAPPRWMTGSALCRAAAGARSRWFRSSAPIAGSSLPVPPTPSLRCLIYHLKAPFAVKGGRITHDMLPSTRGACPAILPSRTFHSIAAYGPLTGLACLHDMIYKPAPTTYGLLNRHVQSALHCWQCSDHSHLSQFSCAKLSQ